MNKDNYKILFKIVTGSHLYGVSTPQSDQDFNGVFIPHVSNMLGLQNIEELNLSSSGAKEDRRNTNEDTDEKYYTLAKWLKMCANNNPTALEYLFVPNECILQDSNEYKFLRTHKDKFLSKRVFNCFSGYALGEKRRLLHKATRFKQLEKVLKYLESLGEALLTDPKKNIDDRWDTLEDICEYYKGSKNNIKHFHPGVPLRTVYELLKKEYEEFGWRLHTDSFEKVGYDVKAGYHLIRLLAEGAELLDTATVKLPLEGQIKKDIMSIRNCEVPLEKLMEMYDVYDARIIEAKHNTKLPSKPDMKWIENFQISTYKDYILNGGI
jgi:hypothetical protein